MKILGISCSPRKEKSTEYCLKKALLAAEKIDGIDTITYSLAQKNINGCIACDYCRSQLGCSQKDDFLNELLPILKDPQLKGILIATPVYFGSMSSQCKAFIDRMLPLRRNGFMLRNKVAGVLAVGGSRNGGQELTIQALHASLLIQDCIIVSDSSHFGSTCWERHPDGLENDTIGLVTAANLGKKIAETILLLNKA